MKIASTYALSLILGASLHAATVNFLQNSVNDVTGASINAVSASQFLEPGSSYSSVTAPTISSSFRFTHWTNNSYPSTKYRDPWGRSLNPISFVLLENTTATARYLPATRDTDGDGIPDWYEIEYFGNLSQTAESNGDGDGISLLAEYSGGSHPLYGNSSQAGGVSYVDSGLVAFNPNDYPTYTVRSAPAGTVSESAVVVPATVITTPDLTSNATFGYWALDGERQQDAWGVALTQISFTMDSTDREAVAYLFMGDTDGDGMPDAYEQYYYGTLSNGADSDTDGDGIPLLAERNGETHPLYANSTQLGGVAWADSALVTFARDYYPTYTLRSAPAGTVSASAAVVPGTVITTPDLAGNSTFGYWTLDGERQQDPWGVALTQISFIMASANREAVAYLFPGDTDGDGVPDAYEQYYYGTLSNGADSDSDGDGIPLLAERNGGTHPLYANSTQAGGLAWADSPIVRLYNTAPFFPGYAVSTPYGKALHIGFGKLLAYTTDIDGHSFSVTAVAQLTSAGGSAQLTASSIFYTPPNGFSGSDSFTITVTDIGGASSSGVVTVNVGANPGTGGGQGGNTPAMTSDIDGRASLRYRALPNTGYLLQRSIDGMATWQDVETIISGPTGIIEWTEPENPPPPSAFYRFRLP